MLDGKNSHVLQELGSSGIQTTALLSAMGFHTHKTNIPYSSITLDKIW